MIPLFGLAAALGGGGYAFYRWWRGRGGSAISSTPLDDFLELRSDGLQQFNRHTAIELLGWLGSVTLKPISTPGGGTTFWDLLVSPDGMPPAADAVASRTLVSRARGGDIVLLTASVTTVGPMPRRALAVGPGAGDEVLGRVAARGGQYAILIVPEKEDVALSDVGPMPGFEGRKEIPGAGETRSIAEETTGGVSGARVDALSTLPPDLRQMVDRAIKKADADPELLSAVAAQLRKGGYVREADVVEKRTGDRHAMSVVEQIDAGRAVVLPPSASSRMGIVELARRLTGDGTRYREILSHNQGLTERAPGYVVPWTEGQVVRLPPGWRTG